MNVTIIGAGNTGIAASCYLSTLGISHLVYTRSEKRAAQWKEFPVKATGALTGSFQIQATANLHDAMVFGNIILICTLATDHEAVIEEIEPELHAGQSVLFFNGCWGALKACRYLARKLEPLHLTVAETANMPFIASLSEDGVEIRIKAIKEEIAYSAVGEDSTVSTLLHKLAPRVTKVSSPASTSLSATNPIIHVTASLFNATRIENGEDFLFFGEPMTDRVISYMEHCDEERQAVANALGLQVSPLLDVLNSFWPDKKDTLAAALKETPSYKTVKGPQSPESRYFSEDLPCGLGAILDLSDMMHIPCPYIKALVTTASLYLGRPYTPFLTKEDLRTLKKL